MSLVSEEQNVCSQSLFANETKSRQCAHRFREGVRSFILDGEMQRCTFGSNSERQRLALSTYGDTAISLLSSSFLPITSQKGQV